MAMSSDKAVVVPQSRRRSISKIGSGRKQETRFDGCICKRKQRHGQGHHNTAN